MTIQLETKRLRIRDHLATDLQDHHELLRDAKVMHFLPELRSYSLEDSLKNLENALAQNSHPSRTEFFMWIETLEEQKHIGEIGYTVMEETPLGKLVEVGYFIRQEFWRQGIVTEAFTEVLRYAFFEGNVYRVLCGCLKENKGSEKVMINCGLIKEGEFKKFQWHENQLKDRVQYRLLKEEFNKLL